MNEKRYLISLIFVSLSFSAFLFVNYVVNERKANNSLRALIPGFTPLTAFETTAEPSPTPSITPKLPAIYTVKKGGVSLIMIQAPDSSKPIKLFETRLPDPILEWRDEKSLYLKSIKNNEAVTFILTLDGQLTQVK